MKKIMVIGGILIIIAFIVWRNMSRDNSKITAVQMEAIQRKTIEQIVSATGNIKPVTEVKISANVSSEIMEIKVAEGDPVQQGQVLVILDSLKYGAYVVQAKSALNASRANYEKVKAEFNRAEQLFSNKLISHQELETLQAAYKLSQSDVEQAEARLEQSKDDLRKTILISPINGTVTSVQKETGEMALGSVFQADVILVISDLSSMEVIVDVDETDVVNINLKNPVEIEVDAIPDHILRGEVTQIAKAAKSASGSLQLEEIVNYEVRVEIDMSTIPADILPGMSATANITTATAENTIAIPIQSLTARPVNERNQEDEEDISLYTKAKEEMEDIVFIALPDTSSKKKIGFGNKHEEQYIVEKRPVKIGISSNNFYQIIEGAEEGEMIVTGNYKAINKDIKDGDKVKKKKRESFRGKKKKDK